MQRFREQKFKTRTALTVRTAPRDKRRAILTLGNISVQAALGRSGKTAFKREGDGGTPIADMKVLYGFMRGDRVQSLSTSLPIKRIHKNMLWCDDPNHPAYNRLVKAPFRPSHEEMKRQDSLYDICLVLDWNITRRSRHRGSAIFFHLIRPGYQPTAGCVAVSLRDMKRLIRFIKPGTVMKVLG